MTVWLFTNGRWERREVRAQGCWEGLGWVRLQGHQNGVGCCLRGERKRGVRRD